MTASLTAWYRARSRREKRLLIVMLALFALVIVWLGIIRPVTDGLADARAAHLTAVDRTATVKAGAALLDRRGDEDLAAVNGPLDQVVAQSAAQAGFTLDSNNPAGADRVSIAIGSARATALLTWIAGLEDRGIVVDDLTMQPGPNRTISARMTLRAARP